MKTFLSKSYAKDIKEMSGMVQSGIADARAMAAGKFTEAEVKEYALTLLTQVSFTNYDDGRELSFFAVAEKDGMPGDARVDFIYTPTYIASSILMHAAMKDSALLDDDDFKSGLMHALNGCTGREFTGHGYDSNSGLLETMDIFRILDTADFVNKYPDFNPYFTDVFRHSVETIKELVNPVGSGSAMYHYDIEKAKELDKYYMGKLNVNNKY